MKREVVGRNKKQQAEDDLDPMLLWMDQRMSCLKKRNVNFTEPSGEANQFITFQGSTMFSMIITTPIVVEITSVITHAQSRPTILKTKQKKGIKKLVTNKPRTTIRVPIFNLTHKAS